MLPFDYAVESGRILTVHKEQAFEQLREPAVPISEEAALVTGLTDEAVAGKSVDEDAVASIVAGADLIIAHNTAFDRPMVVIEAVSVAAEKVVPAVVSTPL